MDLLSLLTGSDNLYKYLFIGGLGLIILSLFYPLNRKYEYITQKDLYNHEVKLLNYDIKVLDDATSKLSNESKSIQDQIKTANIKKDLKAKNLLKASFFKQFDSITSFRTTIEKKKLAIEFNKARVDTLNNHIKDFTKYETIFFYAGILASLVGIIGWYFIMKKTYKSE